MKESDPLLERLAALERRYDHLLNRMHNAEENIRHLCATIEYLNALRYGRRPDKAKVGT